VGASPAVFHVKKQKKLAAREESPIHAMIVVSCYMLSKIIECITIWNYGSRKHFFFVINIIISFTCETK
jgi:hypothetical protein